MNLKLACLLTLLGLPTPLRAQTADTIPTYIGGVPVRARRPGTEFSGREAPALLAAAFARTISLAVEASRGLARAKAYCLQLAGGTGPLDPKPQVLASLERRGVPVRPASQCETARNTAPPVLDPITGGRAWLVTLESLELKVPGIWLLSANYYVEPLFGAGWECRVHYESGAWVVRDCTMTWIA